VSCALVLGSGSGVWADVEAALDIGWFDGAVACNDAAAAWPGALDAAVSYHPAQWPHWLRRRALAGFEPPARVMGHETASGRLARVFERVESKFTGQQECGSSGLFALKVALVDLGFDKAVLCGVPMDPRPHFDKPGAWGDWKVHRQGWIEALPSIAGRARSMSGWTAQLLGRPDEAWLGNL
jgi:hypothetical protein